MSVFQILLFVTSALSVVMLLVLFGLARAGVAGVREWFAANALAAVALPLFALRDTAPEFLTIELANTLLVAAGAFILAGYCRHFSRRVPTAALAAGAATTLAAVAIFHYLVDDMAMRVVAISAFHVVLCFTVGMTILRAPKAPRSRYPYRFAAGAAFMLAIGHGVRLTVYASQLGSGVDLPDASTWNIAFLAIGTMALPLLTIGAVLIVYDSLVARAENMANRDFLTGAWSRRAFFDLAERERMRTQRTDLNLSLLIFDVDHFKKINDNHGHAIGDKVLTDIVLRTEGIIRSIDYCARLGGEEFAVLLPDAGSEEARVVAERIRTAVMDLSWTQGQETGGNAAITCTISAGVAMLRNADETIAELLRRADAALYAAKAMGRNTVVVAGDGDFSRADGPL